MVREDLQSHGEGHYSPWLWIFREPSFEALEINEILILDCHFGSMVAEGESVIRMSNTI